MSIVMWRSLVLCFLSLANIKCQLVVNTKQGQLVGRLWETQKGRTFHGFTGIPYAKPPVGDLRYRAPVAAGTWEGVLNATMPHTICPQMNLYAPDMPIEGNEDCLFLNVYKPEVAVNLPVMFYIHGGYYIIGSGSNIFVGPELLLDHDVVLVAINYRLGSLGFLSTEDDVLPGNNGLKDQGMALRWVKDNIASFGGDPFKITVFGQSAGGMSVNAILMSPLTRHLISGAILQSGSVAVLFTPHGKGTAKATCQKVAQFNKCTYNSSREVVDCLRKKNITELMNNEKAFLGTLSDLTLTPFKPVAEGDHPGAFLPDDGTQMMKDKKFANIPIIIGDVADEGAYKTAALHVRGMLGLLDKDFESIAADSFSITKNVKKTTNAIRKFYFGDKIIDNTTLSAITKMFSDGWFHGMLDGTLALFTKYHFPGQSIYVYLFGYRGSMSATNLLGVPTYNYGVCHTDDLFYLIRQIGIYPEYKPTHTDLQMTDVLTKMWVNFARTGNPTPDTNVWTPLKDENRQNLHILSPTKFGMTEGMFPICRRFWRDNVYSKFWKDI